MPICAIDNGYFATKYINNGLFSIKSRVAEDTDGEFEYQGIRYSIGHGQYNIDHNKTDNELHRIMTYYILSKITLHPADYKLVLSLPMLHYKNLKDSFKDYIKGEGLIKTRINNLEKRFTLNDVTVFMQGAGALYANNPHEYKKGLIGVLDIGGLTAQGAVFENLKPIKDTMFTIDAGMLILNNKIKTRINEKYGLNIQDYEIPYLDTYQEDIRKVIDEHFSTILLEMQSKNWSLATLPILCTGGGGIQMGAGRYIPKFIPSVDPIYDNVKGLQVIGGMIYR